MAGYTRLFRGPRTVTELLDMQATADALRAAGRATDDIDAAIAIARRGFDRDSLTIGPILRSMQNEPMDAMPTIPLNALDVPPVVARGLDDMGPEIAKSVRSYEGLRKAGRPGPGGGTANLPNQPHAKAAGLEMRAAAEEAIQGMREAQAAEAMARNIAGAAAVGGGMMVGESLSRGYNDGPTTADVPRGELPVSRPMDVDLPDVDLLPVDDVPVTDDFVPQAVPMPMPEELALMEDDPMATANLVEESRPIPASTPKVALRTGSQAAEQFLADARAQIDRLNSYRRSGQINPQVDRQMSQEIERMLQLANEARSGR
jgi:hypothetical protein